MPILSNIVFGMRRRHGTFLTALLAAILLVGCPGGSDKPTVLDSTSTTPGGSVVVPPTGAIATISGAGGVVTVTTATLPTVGSGITIAGTTSYNGTFIVSGVTGTGFTFTLAGASTTESPPAATWTAATVFPGSFSSVGGTATITGPVPTDIIAGTTISISGTTTFDGAVTVVSVTPGTAGSITFAFVGAFGPLAGTWAPAGGPLAGCVTTVTTGVAGSITLSGPDTSTATTMIASLASRTSGVAPLAVFFDASGTTTTPATTRPFHDLGYQWSFGDGASGTWGRGSRPTSSRNLANGPLAAHVFETPGLYTINLTITDGTNTVTNSCLQISVQDPDVVFAGLSTLCFSATGTFTDVPAGFCTIPGVTQITTSNFQTALAMATPGTRLLFRRGETWTSAGGVAIPRLTSTGPGIIGAFGASVAAPKVQSSVVAGGNTILAIAGGSAAPNIRDWRIMDLELDGQGGVNSNGVIGGSSAQQFTFLRMNVHDASVGISFATTGLDALNLLAPGGHLIYDQIAVFNSSVLRTNGSGGNGMFLQATRLALLGNLVEDSTAGEHIIRIQYANKAALQANDLGLPANLKSVLTIRAVNNGTGGVTGTNATDQVVITDNLLRGGSAGPGFDQIISVRPSASTEDQTIGNIIFDGNMVRSGPFVNTAWVSSANEVTVRNNVFNLNGGAAYNCMQFNVQGVEAAHSEIRAYNNTCFTSDNPAGAPPPTLQVVILDATNTNVTIKNNLGFAPNMVTAPTFLTNAGSAGVIGAGGTFGNRSDFDIKNTDPLFTNGSATFQQASDFTLGGASTAINGGVTVPVFTDILRTTRPLGGTFDAGATEQ